MKKQQSSANYIDFSKGFSKDDAIKHFVSYFETTYGVTKDEILEFLSESRKEMFIPVSIFDNTKLSSFEAIVKYLKENLGLKNNLIASLLNRDQRTVWATYNNAKRKLPAKLKTELGLEIPLKIFSQREFGVLEILVEYLKDRHSLSYHEIAVLLHRNDRTVWTSYHQIKKKKK